MRLPKRSFIAGLLMGLMCSFLMTGAVGCASDGRALTAIDAEQSSKDTTVPFATAYKLTHPDEVQSVDDFYTAWQGRLDKEKKAAAAP